MSYQRNLINSKIWAQTVTIRKIVPFFTYPNQTSNALFPYPIPLHLSVKYNPNITCWKFPKSTKEEKKIFYWDLIGFWINFRLLNKISAQYLSFLTNIIYLRVLVLKRMSVQFSCSVVSNSVWPHDCSTSGFPVLRKENITSLKNETHHR